MSRLTVKWKDKLYDLFDPVDIADNEYSKINFEKMITKLGEYEDLEEMLGIPFEQMVELCKEHVPDGAKYPKRAKVLTDESVDEWEQYKQDKEQGLLLKLPCKVGDTVWHINEKITKQGRKKVIKFFVDNGEVDNIRLGSVMIPQITLCTSDNHWITFDLDEDWNKNIFLTKEEAEKELERLNEQRE